MLTASICTIGDEILIGQIIDTNSSKISFELNKLGIKVRYMFSIGDETNEIISNLERCLKETDIVIVTGGLGPTKDDITKDALCKLSGSKGYKESSEQMEIIRTILTKRSIEISDINRAQAYVPEKCKVIPNRLGTAPCMQFMFSKEEKYGHKAALYSLPGVPFEAIGALGDVILDIRENFDIEEINHKTIVTFGIPESTLAKKIEKWEEALPEYIKLAYLPNPTIGVRLRLSSYGRANVNFEPQIEELKELLGDAIYGEGEDNLQTVIGRMLRKNGKNSPSGKTFTISAAESCTGGRISELITSVSGCSEYYMGSVTSYSNEAKINILGVSAEIIEKYGAVSSNCVEAMALGVRKIMNTDYSVATSGIAGPDGGTSSKPVGMAWLAVASKNPQTGNIKVISQQVNFASNRAINIERFASYALNLLRKEISYTNNTEK